MATLKELFKIEKNKRNLIITSSILVAASAIGIVAGVQFKQFSDYETYFYVGENVQIEKFSDYSPNLKNTVGDAEIYKIQGKNPGPSVLILGGTHPNEPSGQLTATLFLENLKDLNAGTVYVITETNKSAYTHSHPLEATAFYYGIETQHGVRTFKFGSRATNTNQQWPNPDVYTTQSGQKLSSTDTRNLNRSYPGKINGTYTEQVAYAVTELIRQNDIAVTIDLHEASPEYITINAIVHHQDAADIASDAKMEIEWYMDITVEPSPTNLHGLTHRELGDYTDTLAFLCETSNAAQGKIRGAFTEDLIVTGEDKFYDKAESLGITYAPTASLSERVARHTQTIVEILRAYNTQLSYGAAGSLGKFLDGKRLNEGTFDMETIEKCIPTYDEIMENGVGYYLAEQPEDYK